MTDEELAERWVTDNTGFNPKEPLGKIAVRTFLGGLKAGKDMGEQYYKDMEEQEERLRQEQIQNYDFERGDVKY